MNTQSSGLPDGWRLTRFDEILERVERRFTIDDATEYSRVGVRWYGNGAFIRDREVGANIARKQQWIIRAGDVVYNKLFAWKGAFAVAHDAVDGYIVSDKFPTYSLDTARVDARYLGHYFRTHQICFQAERLSKGAAAISKLTLNPPQLGDLTIPLPTLAEQERLAAILDDVKASLVEAEQLRSEAEAETTALVAAAIGDRMAVFSTTGTLYDVLTEPPRNGWSPRCDNSERGTAVLGLGAVTGFTYRASAVKRTSEPTSPDGHYWLQSGDLLVTRSNTEQLLGHAAIYTGEPSPCIYPDLMMRLKVDDARADTRFVYYWLRTPSVRTLIRTAGSGTSSTMKKITQKDVMRLPFPVGASLSNQRQAVDELDEITSRIDAARTAQLSSNAALSAVMPSLIDRVFQGKLHAAGSLAPHP